jgi:BON domain
MRRSGGWDDEGGRAGEAIVFALGAAGGFALGLLFSGRMPDSAGVREAGARLRERAADVARTLGPGRLRRELREQVALTGLEDAVLDAFLRDEVLSDRPIDVGAISRGIIELSGSVRSAAEAARAVQLAREVDGVETVVNRMDVEEPRPRRGGTASGDEGMTGGEWTGREVGMGRRRQGHETDPDRPDDSRQQKTEALEDADRVQFADEGYGRDPRVAERPDPGDPLERTRYREDELDNQSPYGKHAVPAVEQPQAMHSHARVGEGIKPGTELALEAADVPVKPHSREALPGGATDET